MQRKRNCKALFKKAFHQYYFSVCHKPMRGYGPIIPVRKLSLALVKGLLRVRQVEHEKPRSGIRVSLPQDTFPGSHCSY